MKGLVSRAERITARGRALIAGLALVVGCGAAASVGMTTNGDDDDGVRSIQLRSTGADGVPDPTPSFVDMDMDMDMDIATLRRETTSTLAEEAERAAVVDAAFAELDLPGDIRGPRPRRATLFGTAVRPPHPATLRSDASGSEVAAIAHETLARVRTDKSDRK